MYAEFGASTFVICTFTRNSANYGGGFYIAFSDADVTNSVFWNNAGTDSDIYLDWGAGVVINYSDIIGNWGGTGNITGNPLFVDPNNGDFSLLPASPCVNSGDPGSNVPLSPRGNRSERSSPI